MTFLQYPPPPHRQCQLTFLAGRPTPLWLLARADSKALTAEKRERLFKRLKETKRIGWTVASIPATEISHKMLRRQPYSLNAISHDCAIELVKRAQDAGVNVTEVFVDTVGDPQRYQDMLTARFRHTIKFVVAKKADSIYPCVSAASICAKVTRDLAIDKWEFKERGFVAKGEMGSGYPGDAITKGWLRANTDHVFGFPSLARFSWSTSKDLLEEVSAEVEWEEEDSEKVGASIVGFFGAAARKPKRCAYMKKMALESVDDL